MKSLKILSLSNNLLRGSMPEGLISKLGATKVQKLIMPGNRLADVDTVSTAFPPPRIQYVCSLAYCLTLQLHQTKIWEKHLLLGDTN